MPSLTSLCSSEAAGCAPLRGRTAAGFQACAARLKRLGASVFFGLTAVHGVHALDFPDVEKRAQELAKSPYRNPENNLPKEIGALSIEQYGQIQYDMDKRLWKNDKSPFAVTFYHQGSYFNYPVRINHIENRKAHEVRFDTDDFGYGNLNLPVSRLRGLGFAGLRVHYPLNKQPFDELISFLGASYFRALGRGQQYGLSARGLAIDTGLNSGEEFPRFTEFWIERPAAKDRQIVLYALLDSPRAAGAYRFTVRPGDESVVDVKARLYLRANVSKLGIAPLTSMFFFGENQAAQYEDYRPEVHDSDGLSIQSGTGEWIWRPLLNPKRLLITSYSLSNPTGFGLMQRDRNFNDYQDLEARYDLRPSVWVQPKGSWGAGRVELVQIPTPDENNDNIVAYWVPDNPPKVGQPYDIEYSMYWQKNNERRAPLSSVTRTLRGQKGSRSDGVGLAVDFEGPVFAKLTGDIHPEAVLSSDDNGKVVSSEVVRNDVTGGWRMRLRVRQLDESKPVELRAFLRYGSTTLSETWSYILPPN